MRKPRARDRDDIEIGFGYLRAAGPFDVGQAVVVAGKQVLAVEAVEGTDQMLTRIAEMRVERATARGKRRGRSGQGGKVERRIIASTFPRSGRRRLQVSRTPDWPVLR